MATYKVLAPLVQLKVPDVGGVLQFQHFYAGAVVPEGVDPASLKVHVDSGQIVKESAPEADVFAVPAGTPLPLAPPNVDVTEAGTVAQPQAPLTEEQVKAAKTPPSKSK